MMFKRDLLPKRVLLAASAVATIIGFEHMTLADTSAANAVINFNSAGQKFAKI